MTPEDERLFITWFTSAADRCEHAITDDEAGRAFESGTDPDAVCGRAVTPVSLMAPPGPRCRRCREHVGARLMPREGGRAKSPTRRGGPNPSLLWRLFSHKPSAQSFSAGWAPQRSRATAASLSVASRLDEAVAHHVSDG